MERLTFHRVTLRAILVMCSMLVLRCAMGGPVFAQHAGGPLRGGVYVSAPPVSHVMIPRPIPQLWTNSVGAGVHSFGGSPPLIHFGPPPLTTRPILGNRFPMATLTSLQAGIAGPVPPGPHVHSPNIIIGYPRWSIRPFRPVFPISAPFTFGYPAFGIFGARFFGLGFGFSSGLWPSCNFSVGWAYGCNGLPAYDYGPRYNVFSYSPGISELPIETKIWPLYIYGAEGASFVQLYLKDGTVYGVIDYWLVDNQLHFKTVEENGTKVVEHVIDFDQLDLQKTVDVNTQRGFRFVLRDEPIDQYLQDHPIGSPAVTPPSPPQLPAP